MGFGRCRSCGATVFWILVKSGKMMPCDAEPEQFHPDPRGPRLYILNDGHTMRGTPLQDGEEPGEDTAVGNISHFATCPGADKFRRGRA